jgi:hypothetical protein
VKKKIEEAKCGRNAREISDPVDYRRDEGKMLERE